MIRESRNITAATRSVLIGLFSVFVFAFVFAGVAAAAGGEKSSAEATKEALYQLGNLLLLLGIFYYFGRKPVSEFFASRREGIQSDLSEAANLLAEAEQRNSELQRRLVDLNSEVAGIKATATQRANDEAERIVADARATADRIRTDAQAAIDQELRRAQSTLREEAADLALKLAAEKLESNVGEADRDRLVDEFITRIEPNGDVTEGAH